jgi:hypothetical protein
MYAEATSFASRPDFSGWRLKKVLFLAEVAELVDALDSKSSEA